MDHLEVKLSLDSYLFPEERASHLRINAPPNSADYLYTSSLAHLLEFCIYTCLPIDIHNWVIRKRKHLLRSSCHVWTRKVCTIFLHCTIQQIDIIEEKSHYVNHDQTKLHTVNSHPLIKIITFGTCDSLLVTISSRLGKMFKWDFSNFFIIIVWSRSR